MKNIKKAKKRLKDNTAEEVKDLTRNLTKNSKTIKVQKTLREIKKDKRKGIIEKPRGIIVKGDYERINSGKGIIKKYTGHAGASINAKGITKTIKKESVENKRGITVKGPLNIGLGFGLGMKYKSGVKAYN